MSSAYYLQKAGHDVFVYEAQGRAGGTAQSDFVDGFTVDRGPNGFLTNVHDALELVDELGLKDELAVASDLAQKRFLFKDGRLQALPASPGAFLKTELVSTRAKGRLLLEPFAKKRDPDEDETVYNFAKRHIGEEFAETFMRTMVVGITAGDAREISLAALFPRMRALEDEYGSLIRGMVAKQLAAAREKGTKDHETGGPAGPGGRLTSFREGGAGRLAQALAEVLGERVRLGSRLEHLTKVEGRYHLSFATGERQDADAVVLATPAFVAADLLQDVCPQVQQDLQAIPYADVVVLGLGYKKEDVPHDLQGFGYLVAPGEDQRILGCLWSSSCYPEQAPAGHVLLRVIAGGVLDPLFISLSDDEALSAVREDLKKSLGVSAAPSMVTVVRWLKGIPQYTVGHQARVLNIMKGVQQQPGLYLTGNAYRGVSLNDCVRDAKRIAADVAHG